MPESQGNPPPNGGQGTGTPEGTDKSQQQIPAGMTAEDFNRAFSDREKALQKKFAKDHAERETALEQRLTEGFSKTLAEQLAALKGKEPPLAAAQAGGKDPVPVKLEDLPEWKEHKSAFDAQQKQLERFKKAAEDSEKRAQLERERSRSTALRTAAIEGLGKVGITPDRAEHALAFLNSKNHLAYADEGKGDELVFRAGDSEVPLVDGLRAWGKTPDAKIYLPPQNPHGSGGGPGAPGSGANNPYTQIEQLLTEHVRGR